MVESKIGLVRISSKGWRKVKNGTKSNYKKAQLIPSIVDIIKNGEYLGKSDIYKERKDNIVLFHSFQGNILVGNDMVKAVVLVGEDAEGNLFYDIIRGDLSNRVDSGNIAKDAETRSKTSNLSINQDNINIKITSVDTRAKETALFSRSNPTKMLMKRK